MFRTREEELGGKLLKLLASYEQIMAKWRGKLMAN